MLGMTDMDRDLTEMDQSALLEIGNIMVSAFLDGTADLLNIIMLPSPPNLVIDMPHAVIQSILASQEYNDINEVVIFRTELKSDEHHNHELPLPAPKRTNAHRDPPYAGESHLS